jgi:DNA (cytosine-5)-methyltransferase 1
VANLGDFTTIRREKSVELLVGGTPCQSFSVIGQRGGLDDARGNLAIEFCHLAGRLRPLWVVWENVPGVLSSSGGRDFGAILSTMAELGYGCAWRVLDAQFFGVPQRRRRVFVVGYLGDWRRAAAVLFERESLRGGTAARGKTRKQVGTLSANGVGVCGVDDNQARIGHLITHPLRCEGFDASGDSTGRGTPVTFYPDTFTHTGVRKLTPRECERLQGFPDDWTRIPNYRRKLCAHEIDELAAYFGITLEEARAVGSTPDAPRYRAIGNSMAVPVMRWIGSRIDLVNQKTRERK